MEKLIQFRTSASLYDGAFDNVAGWSAAGMGYVLVTKSNKFIVIDGGYKEDSLALIGLLEKYSGKSVPTVDLWIITHSHGDHYGALQNIAECEELCKRINVKKLCYYFPAKFRDRGKRYCNLSPIEDMKRIAALLGAKHHVPFIDEKLSVDGIELHFLYVPSDYLAINDSYNSNACSLIFTLSTENKKIMITGDAVPKTMQMTCAKYGDILKCDILQMPHHALCDTGDVGFFSAVDAKTLLLPISIAGDRSMNDIYFEQNTANRWAQDNADKILKAFEGTIEIEV